MHQLQIGHFCRQAVTCLGMIELADTEQVPGTDVHLVLQTVHQAIQHDYDIV